MITLTASEKIWVYYKLKGKKATITLETIKGFNALGIILNDIGLLPFSAGLFYGFGYGKKPASNLFKRSRQTPS